MTLSVLESSLQMNTRSAGSIGGLA
jgi:hypothetical protein